MFLRLLDHPLDSKCLRPLEFPGVYVFIATERQNVEKIMHAPSRLLEALRSECEVLYVGKAKRLKHRLQNYRQGGRGSAGEWYKTSHLNESAHCVLVIPTPTHFEACLLELFLIRILTPPLNDTSTAPGRIYFVLQDKESRRLTVSLRKKSGLKVWGFVRARSQVRLAFDALTECFESYRSESDEIVLHPGYSRFGRTIASGRLIVDVSRQQESLCRLYLSGRKSGILDALWNSMKKAANEQHFHRAAQLRDRYRALHQLQLQLKRSRSLVRRYRMTTFVLPTGPQCPERRYSVERFLLTELNGRTPSRHRLASLPFVSLLTTAMKEFNDELAGEHESERLRVNFEFLRLMLWWHENQLEECSTLS